MWARLGLCAILWASSVLSFGEVAEWQRQREKAADALFQRQEAAAWGVELLQKAAGQGNVDAQSDLAFARLLGTGVAQDIDGAAASSRSLAGAGGARAHTTQALLLSHNLTGTSLTQEERRSQAVSHYLLAAMGRDPLAEIMVGRHYWKGGDCDAALQYLRRAAAATATTEEEARGRVPPRFLWPQDGLARYQAPSLDEFQFLEYSALGGDPEAALRAGVLLSKGVPGVGRDPERAASYLRQAAKANSTTAMVLLAAMRLHGATAPGDPDDAMELLQLALGLGDKSAHTYLGLLYSKGHGAVPKNLAKARKHLEQGIKTGSVEAFYLLGKVYEDPDSSGSLEEAMTMWEVSATFGHVPSAFRVAEDYWRRMQKAATTTVSPGGGSSALAENLCRSALPLYRMISLSGNWQYLQEAAYEDYVKGRHSAALLKYLLLSDLGYAAAHVNAGRLLDSGSSGVYGSREAAYGEALKVWGRAADAGLATGHVRLGDMHYYGQGTPEDPQEAARHYSEAARLGSPQAMFSLAGLTEWGLGGVPQNLTRARELYEAALDADEDAYAPVSMALLAMDLLARLNATLGVDVYGSSSSPRAWMPPWDAAAMAVLAAFVVALLAFGRGRQAPPRG